MTTSDTVLSEGSLTVRPDGLAIALSLPWYRSVWLSSVSRVDISIDGTAVPPDDLRFELAGKIYGFDDLGQQWDTLWFIQDRLVAVAPVAETPAVGTPVDVEATVELRLPYMQIAPETYVANRATTRLTLAAQTGGTDR